MVPGPSLSDAAQLHWTRRRARDAYSVAGRRHRASAAGAAGAGWFWQECARLALAHTRRGARRLAARSLVEFLRRRRQLRTLPDGLAEIPFRRKHRCNPNLGEG